MALPRFVVLKSNYNNKYMRHIKEDELSYNKDMRDIQEDVEEHGILQFSGEEVVSPHAKFEVEMAKSGKGLVHLRCCYNNKYWVSLSQQNNEWIVAVADKPEEEQSKWSCTLFKPVCVDDDAKKFLFLHVQLGHYVCFRIGTPFDSCLFAGPKDPNQELCTVFTIIDWESLVIIPKHVAFKGDNGNYLSARWVEEHQYLQFASTDIGDPTVGNEVFTTPDGSIRIKSDYFGKFWTFSREWIWADTDDTSSNDLGTLFWPIKVDNTAIALRNLGNHKFCKGLSIEGKTDCLNAGVYTISKETRIKVVELVISRQIYNVNFRLKHARMYNQRVLKLATKTAINRTPESNNAELKFSYRLTKSSTWKSSVSFKLGVKATFEACIPYIIEGKIEISGEFSWAHEWGETTSETTEVDTVYKVTVPPRTMVTVSLLATMGSCDVPFSYSQRDTLTNGKQITYIMDDGIYSSDNSFNFKYETKQEELPVT